VLLLLVLSALHGLIVNLLASHSGSASG
jgi:hypothetical protein